MPKRPLITELIIIIAGILLFIPFLGGLHLFDWDEINFAESAREMIVTGDYLTVRIDFQPFWEKPPLFNWMQVVSMKLFGINEFAARFPNAICGILTMLVLYRSGRKVYDHSFGILWIIVYLGSILPFFYFKSGIIDPWFNLFIFLGLLQFIYLLETTQRAQRWRRVILSACMIGLAVLTKGPVAVLLFGLTVGVYWMINRFRLKINIWEILVYVLVMGFVGGIWFIIQIMIGNEKIISDFITYQIRLLRTQDAGHGGFFLYHIVILLFGVFPASIFALKGFRRSYYDESPQKRFKYWMIMLFLVVLVVFSIVKTKIVHYSSLCYFPLTYLGAYVVSKIIRNRIRNFLWLNWVYGVIGTLYASMSIALPLLLINKDWIIREGWIKDEFALGNLQADVHWSGWESAIGFLFLVGIILSLLMVRKRKNYGYSMLFLNTTLYTLLSILFITPRIEGYSQNALIEFCKERQDEECYVETLGMKSYAHYFYTNREPPENEKANDADWLLKGDIDKTAYFILRNRSVKRYMEQYPDLKEYYSKNGFAFLIREPEQDNIKENSDDQ